MKPVARLAAATLLFAALPAQAAELCAVLQTVAQSAGEPVPFKSISGGLINKDPGRLSTSAPLPRFAQCEVQPRRVTIEYSCYTLSLSPAAMQALEASVVADLRKCLGDGLARTSEAPISTWGVEGSYPALRLESAAGQVAFTLTANLRP